METGRFRTRQEFKTTSLPKGKDYIIGLDIGYSGTKIFCENMYMCFPSYAKKLDTALLDLHDSKDIFYKNDDTGEIYMVGYMAQNMAEGTNDTEAELYSRKRYSAPRFKVLCQTAIGLSIMNKIDAREIVIQTGLPSSYSKDAPLLKKALSDSARFSLRVGAKSAWRSFNIEIKKENIHILPQPMGALYSAIVQSNGMYTKDAMEILKGNTMVLDAGFGTFDFYGIKDRRVDCQDSLDDISMRQVFANTVKKIGQEYGEDIRIPELNKCLSKGVITCFDEEEMGSEEKDFSELLRQANDEVFEDAKAKIRSVTKSFRDYKNIIIDGGTGEAWYEKICDWLKDMKTINIIPSNRNDHLPLIYSNARGYYLFRYTKNKR